MAILRQSIFDEVESRFKTITIANGYRTDLGNHVLKWREVSTITVPELPAVSIGDTQEEPEIANVTRTAAHKRTLTITYSLLNTGTDTESIITYIRKMQADIEDAIREDDKWNGNALWTRPKGNQMGFDDKPTSSLVGILTGSFEIIYLTELFNSEN